MASTVLAGAGADLGTVTPAVFPNGIEVIPAPMIDTTQPLSALLKTCTSRAHDQISDSEGAKFLLSGNLPRDDYIKYLFTLWHIYDTLERILEKHATYPTLAPSYNPRILARSEVLSNDIAHFLDVKTTSPSAWQSHPFYQAYLPFPSSLTAYLARLEELSTLSDPTPLIAHSYVRYLGDLSGGQYVKRISQKAYGLEHAGYSFYEFSKLGGTTAGGEVANVGDMKKLKDWYKDCIDASVVDPALKIAVVHEAVMAFDLNGGLLSTLDEGSETTRTGSPTESDEESGSPVAGKLHHDVDTTTTSQSGFAIPAFLTVLLAVGMAHFLLTIGGFTGKRGGEKMDAVLEYLGTSIDGIVGAFGGAH